MSRWIFGRTPRLAYGLVRFNGRAADQFDAVGNGGENAGFCERSVFVADTFQRLPDGCGPSRQIQYQGGMVRTFADDGNLSGQYGGRNEMQADLTHPFRKSRHFPGADGKGGIRCLVASCRAGSSCGQNQRAAVFVNQFVQGFFDLFLIVRYQTGFQPVW